MIGEELSLDMSTELLRFPLRTGSRLALLRRLRLIGMTIDLIPIRLSLFRPRPPMFVFVPSASTLGAAI